MSTRARRRVVITGLGLVSPLGQTLEANRDALRAGRGAVRAIEAFPIDGVPTRAVGEVREFEAQALAIGKNRKALKKNLKYMARDIQLAVAAAERALEDAGLATPGSVDPTRIGIDLGAGMISSELDELAPAINLSTSPEGVFDFETYGRAGIPEIVPIWLLKYLPNMLACHIGVLNDCQGPSNTITQGESASNAAVGEAVRIIERGKADVMVTGAGDSKIHPLSLIRMNLLGQLSRWEGPEEGACRPFDRRRSGWVPGEGAGILILESLDHARGRGARIYGEVLGYGCADDGHRGGGIDERGTGVELATRAALRDAGLQPGEVGHVNAHGAGIVAYDLAESAALNRVFGLDVPVVGLKGYVGNLGSGSGAFELVASLLTAREGFLPATLNCDELDPACPIDVVRGAGRTTVNPTFLNVNFTRYGQASAVLVRALAPGATLD